MQNLMNDLTKLFQKDDRIFADGKLLKNKLTELALKLDQPLVELLLSDKRTREHFFIEQILKKDKVLVFDKDKFISFVNNKEFLPDSFTSFKNKIGLMTNGDYLKEKSDVVLAWAYKDCVLEGGQDKEDQRRDEIFYNETLAPDEIDRLFEPKVLKNFKKYDSTGEHKVAEFSADDNLIIKGNNLLALHCLKKKYRGEVKLIYIDPPFNRKADTFYNDKFRHSTWMTFMRNRLNIAKDFLLNEGFICVHLDDIEMAYCKVIMDEIFGESHYRNTIALKTNDPSGFKATGESIFSTANYILIYSKGDIAAKMKKVYIETPYDSMYNKVLLNKDDSYTQWKWVNINEYIAKEKGFSSTKEAKKTLGEEFNIFVEEYALNNADKVFRTAAIGGGARIKRIATIEKSKTHKDKVFVHPNEDVEGFYILNGEGIVFYKTKVFQINGMNLTGAVITDVGYGPLYFDMSKNERESLTKRSLESVEMLDCIDRPSHHLSMGEKRRVSLAAVLACKPEILAMDEPAASLDPKRKKWLVDFIKKNDRTIIIATHDLRLAYNTCDRCVLMNKGKIVADGNISDILSDSQLLLSNDLEPADFVISNTK